ncbi:MAG: nucleoside deaminase [bacterium]
MDLKRRMEEIMINEIKDKNWMKCFEIAWEAYCNGSYPIGALVVNNEGDIISIGRSMQNEEINESQYIVGNKLSHAELNALIQIKQSEHPNINNYTLYTTMEPCPLCFGAFIMSWVRNLKFAARDRYAGATELNEKSGYIKSKQSKIIGPHRLLERIQIAMQTDFILRRANDMGKQKSNILIDAWRLDSPDGVKLGEELFETDKLQIWKKENYSFEEVYDKLTNR